MDIVSITASTPSCVGTSPVLEPDLHLPGAEAGNFPCQPFAMGSIGVRLSGELAHQESGLIVREPGTTLALLPMASRWAAGSEPEALHLPLVRTEFCSSHRPVLDLFFGIFTSKVNQIIVVQLISSARGRSRSQSTGWTCGGGSAVGIDRELSCACNLQVGGVVATVVAGRAGRARLVAAAFVAKLTGSALRVRNACIRAQQRLGRTLWIRSIPSTEIGWCRLWLLRTIFTVAFRRYRVRHTRRIGR